jgi:hypothetical protein
VPSAAGKAVGRAWGATEAGVTTSRVVEAGAYGRKGEPDSVLNTVRLTLNTFTFTVLRNGQEISKKSSSSLKESKEMAGPHFLKKLIVWSPRHFKVLNAVA